MTPSADESVKFLTDKLKNREPFVFTKFGDGDLYWMADNPVPIAGGETFRPGIGQELRDAARSLAALPHVYFGDQLTCASGPYLPDEQLAFIRYRSPAGSPLKPIDSSRWLHFECLLIHRLSPELLEFYRVLCSMDGLAMCAGDHLDDAAMHMLGVEWFINVSRTGAHEEWKDAVIAPVDLPWSILLLAAGRASKMIAAKLATQFPTRTIIELGSALDPLFVGRTRSEQVEPEKAREYFKELL